MAVILTIALPFGRYSATPWGRHVNEGSVEWPPSPWRIVRALVASWHIHHDDVAEEVVRSALELLCSPPTYYLPDHGFCVSRHYLPDAKDKRASRSTGLALNSAVVVAPGDTFRIVWSSQASASNIATLTKLASTVSYLGRAESRVSIDVSDSEEPPPGGLSPLVSGDLEGDDTLDLLMPSLPLNWDAIHTTTRLLHKDRWTTPPSTTWVTYRVPKPASPRAREPDRPSPLPLQVMQFAVSGRGRPSMSSTALLGALLRKVVTSQAQDDASLHGHASSDDADPRPRSDDHRHAHYLVLNDLAAGSRVDRLVIWVPEGLSASTVALLAELHSLYVPKHLQKRLGSTVKLALEYVGSSTDLDGRLVGPAVSWRTLTPVTTTRHRKRRETEIGFVEDVVRRELAHRGFPSEGDQVEVRTVRDTDVTPGALQSRRVYRARRLGRDRQQTGFHVELKFRRPIEGPLTLGSLTHFGLGTFVTASRASG